MRMAAFLKEFKQYEQSGDWPNLVIVYLPQDHTAGTVRRVRGRHHGKAVLMTYRARPFMGPAFEQEKAKLPALWAGSVK